MRVAVVLSALLLVTSGACAQDAAENKPDTAKPAPAKPAPAQPAAQSATRTAQSAATPAAAKPASGKPDQGAGELYTVKEGTQVDEKTLMGWKTWRALACERCHGAAQEGLVGPSPLIAIQKMSMEEFHTLLMNGRPEKGMPPFSASKMVTENWEGLYAYLKGRAKGDIEPGRLSPLEGP